MMGLANRTCDVHGQGALGCSMKPHAVDQRLGNIIDLAQSENS